MKKILIFPIVLFAIVFELKAQTGINIRTPHASAILDVDVSSLPPSGKKGVLLPRLNITSLTNKAPVTAATMADGLLAYNNGGVIPSTNTNSQTLYYWDVLANAGLGAWMQQLYFKETPKVATIGLINNLALLNDKGIGESETICPPINNFKIISSGYMPGLRLDNNGYGQIAVGPGTYTLEISYLLNAPPANPTSNATLIGGGYYNMGYFSDLYILPYNPSTNTYGVYDSGSRVEGAILSKINVDHRMRFLHTFAVSGAGLVFELSLDLGRRDGSSFYDLVNVIASGTVIKLTKLN